MKPNTKKPITMTKIITTYARFAYTLTAITALVLLYEGFHIRRGSIFKAISFIVVTILFYHYAKKAKKEEDKDLECTRENFYARRIQERRISLCILILICIFVISSVISISGRRPSWEYHGDKQKLEKLDSRLKLLPDTIPQGAENITYYYAVIPLFYVTLPNFYLRYTLNDKDYEQAKKEIARQGTLEKLTAQQSHFNVEPEDIEQNINDYHTYLFSEVSEYNTLGVMLNDKKNEICYFYAMYSRLDDLEELDKLRELEE